jgi:hypothetical protein
MTFSGGVLRLELSCQGFRCLGIYFLTAERRFWRLKLEAWPFRVLKYPFIGQLDMDDAAIV